MRLWNIWMEMAEQLSTVCARKRTSLWFYITLISLSLRTDLLGVTSFIRVLALKVFCYDRLLDFFHSAALCLQQLTSCWANLVFNHFPLIKINNRIIFIGDGIKIPKSGRKMPGVKKLHQESENNNKPEFIFGHSFQSVGVLAGNEKHAFSVPLTSRIHEGVIFSNRDSRTLLDKMISLFLSLPIPAPCYFVADAYYACQSIIKGLVDNGHHLVTRVKRNSVAYEKPLIQQNVKKGRGRNKVYGDKIKVRTLLDSPSLMEKITSPIPGEEKIKISVRIKDLIWRRVGMTVRFAAVKHPVRGNILLMTTDLSLDASQIILIYFLRFKIEVSFKQAVKTLGSYAYHFWMKEMKPLKRKSGNQYLHRENDEYRIKVLRKLGAYHRFVQIGLIAQGLLQYLSCCYSTIVWKNFGSYIRTIRPDVLPSEMVTACCLRSTFPEFLADKGKRWGISKLLQGLIDLSRSDGLRLAA